MRRSPQDIAQREIEAARRLLGPGYLECQIIEERVDRLIPYANNARTHSDKQIEAIARSIQAVGFVNPVLATRDGAIVAGHGRVAAAKRLGLASVPVIRIEGLTEDQIRAYRLADNRLAELAGWDRPMIEIEMQHLAAADLGFAIEAIGWEMPEIDIFLNGDGKDAAEIAEAGDPDDEPAEIASAAVSRPGDIWLLDGHRLICGSALDPETMKRLMDGKVARQLLQDPPWGIPVQGFISTKKRHREFVMGSKGTSETELQHLLDGNLDVALPHLVDGAILETFIDWRSVDKVILAGKSRGLELINICVWNKSNGSLGSLWRSKYELCVVFKKPGAPHVNNVQLGRFGRYRTNVWDFPGCNVFGKDREALDTHPTAKTVAMIAEAMRDVSNVGEIVLDCFMGSGTALIAAERTGRLSYGIELDPLYVDAAVRRWQKLTKHEATLDGSDLTFEEVAEERLASIDDGEPDKPGTLAPAIRHRPRPGAAA